MTCPKCNKIVNPDWLCCPFHTELVMLKEKCPECGEMEKVNRKICESLITKASDARNKYIQDRGNILVNIDNFIFAFSYTCILVFGGMFILESTVKSGLFLNILYYFLWAILCMITMFYHIFWITKKKGRFKQEFFRLHPNYAEILKKAESADAKSFDGRKEEEK